MRNKVAKRLRRKIYEDLSRRQDPHYKVFDETRTCTGLRAEFRKEKKNYKGQ
jgi:hypothetical protein